MDQDTGDCPPAGQGGWWSCGHTTDIMNLPQEKSPVESLATTVSPAVTTGSGQRSSMKMKISRPFGSLPLKVRPESTSWMATVAVT